MQLYRFSPISSLEELSEAIDFTHRSCYTLCKQTFGYYLPNAGNIGIFSHYENEYLQLIEIRNAMTFASDDPKLKYFTLKQPIIIAAEDGIPQTTYTHIYIRRPDTYRAQVGDIDFYIEISEYAKLKQSFLAGHPLPGARLFDRTDLDMIELYNPDIDALGYVSSYNMSQKVHLKLSDATTL